MQPSFFVTGAVAIASMLALDVAAAPAVPAVPGSAPADRFADVTIEARHVAGPVHMLTGAGGNIGASIGIDGTLIIDDQFAPLAERIAAELARIRGERPRLVLNTHFHGDHTGGNAEFGAEGTIIAHENVRLRLLNAPETTRVALPVVTFADRVRVHFNDDDIDVMHLPVAHTDGDSVVWFRKANVVHMGDLYFNGRFPFIDLEGGGSVAGFLSALDAVLGWMPQDAAVIPGHGELSNRASLASWRETIGTSVDVVREGITAGKSLDALIADGLGPQYAALGSGFINEENWIRLVHASLTGTRPPPRP